MIKKPTHAEKEQELEGVFGNVSAPDDDVMNVGVSPGMAQAQQLMTGTQSAGQMMESTVVRSQDAQRIALANMTTGCTQLLSNPNELEPKHHKAHTHKVNKRLFRLLSELKAAKKR